MASSINIAAISGNLTRDPELRMTPGGTQVLNFGVAVDDRTKNQQTGEWEDRPNFIDCVLFGNRADALSRILRKGIKVTVSGSLRWSQWERDGQKRSKVEVVADKVVLMQAQQDGRQQPAYPQPAYPPRRTRPSPPTSSPPRRLTSSRSRCRSPPRRRRERRSPSTPTSSRCPSRCSSPSPSSPPPRPPSWTSTTRRSRSKEGNWRTSLA